MAIFLIFAALSNSGIKKTFHLHFKGKGVKANNKNNYRGITLFPTFCKIYKMVLIYRLENYVEQNGLFCSCSSDFKEGVGCTKTSFTILETINHMIEHGKSVWLLAAF